MEEADPPTPPTPIETGPSFRDTATEHIFRNVLGIASDTGMYRALDERGLLDMDDILSLDLDEIKSLTYTQDNRQHAVLFHHKKVLESFQNYIIHMNMEGDRVRSVTDYFDISRTDFTDFRRGDGVGFVRPTAPSKRTSSSTAKTPAEEFRKGIKRDPKLFEIFKNDENWDAFHRKVITEARSQGVEDVLLPEFMPMTVQETALFEEKQKYMMSVFSHVLKTTNGINILQKHSKLGDAQQVWKDLCEKYDESTRGDLSAAQFLSFISSARLGDSFGKVRPRTLSFIGKHKPESTLNSLKTMKRWVEA